MYHTKLFALFVLISLSLCSGASFYPKSLTTQKSVASTQPITVLQTKDQSGDQDTWNNYIEFDGTPTAYKGVFTFDVSSIAADTVSSFTLNVNFKGPQKSSQAWQFEWSIPAAQTWVLAGDNAAASSWKWSSLSFAGSVPFASLVSAGSVQLRYSAKTVADNSDLDFVELVVVTSSQSTSTPKPSTTPKPTPTPTTPATSAPTTPATSAPTSKPTTTPKPTSTPKPTTTTPPTTPPTSTPKPTNPPQPSAGARICPAGSRWMPAPGTSWQWQLTGTVNTDVNVQVYDIDMFSASQSLIDSLHAKGRAVICYIDTAYEPDRPDSKQFTAAVLGTGIDGWPGQKWVDIRSPIVRNIMVSRIAQAAAKKCDGVEMDDVDAYQNSPGFPLTAADQLSFNKFLATTAHSFDLSIALKNDIDQIASLVNDFDYGLNEQCYQYGECDGYSAFINQGKAVFGVEYELATSKFCSQANSAKFSWLKKGLDLDASLTQCCTSCTATYSCKPTGATRSINLNEEQVEQVEEVVAESVVVEEVAPQASSASQISGFAFIVVIASFVALL